MDADLMGVTTSNTTNQPNWLNSQATLFTLHKKASPPNPIERPQPDVWGMLDILDEFPFWQKTLNRSRLCFSVTSAINYVRTTYVNINYRDEILGPDENVQRYTRKRFVRRTSEYGGARVVPVEGPEWKYEFDNITLTHFWNFYIKDRRQGFFAYDKADTLGQKVTTLLNRYPDGKCIVFDDLGEDSSRARLTAHGTTVVFEPYELLHAVVQAMTSRYGPAFPAQYY